VNEPRNNNHCPHCAHGKSRVVAHAFNNGSAQSAERRCELCNCLWRENRQGICIVILERGWTPAESKQEATRIASMHFTYAALDAMKAPDHWALFV